jgi:hypothetical protein
MDAIRAGLFHFSDLLAKAKKIGGEHRGHDFYRIHKGDNVSP